MVSAAIREANGKSETLEWVTPDDFLVRLDRAPLGDRLGALLVDVVILALANAILIGAMVLLLLAAGWSDAGQAAPALILVVRFFVSNGYWTWFEGRRMGMTPGKKILGIQVIRPKGGPLSLSTALARNLSREVELWLPLWSIVFLRHGAVEQGAAFIWCLAFMAVPLLDPKGRRAGDFLAGTTVVKRPDWRDLPRELLRGAARPGEEEGAVRWVFTTAMLEVYGTTQVNALQEVLDRSGSRGIAPDPTLLEIRDKVVRKIGFAEPVRDEEARLFLLAFYRAMREYLEGQIASGRTTLEDLRKAAPPTGSRFERFYRPPE